MGAAIRLSLSHRGSSWYVLSPRLLCWLVATVESYFVSLHFASINTGISGETVSFTETTMDFTGNSEGQYFEAHLEFYKPIVAADCKWKTHPLGTEIYIAKKPQPDETTKEQKYWPHLLKDKSLETVNTVRLLLVRFATYIMDVCTVRLTPTLRLMGSVFLPSFQITTDWNHYVDPDEEDSKETGFNWNLIG